MNEILGVSSWAPIIFGTQAPDTGNAEIIAHYGTDEQKAKYLEPLLDGEVFSCYSMTEPQAGSDPQQFTTRAVRDGDEWVIDGWKFFSSNARTASFLIVMAITDPDVAVYQGASMFLVPTDTPGVDIERNIGLGGESEDEGMHALIHYDEVRVPADHLLGGEGQAFAIAQTRLGGGRVHHAMRSVATCQRALDLMCERVLSRETQGGLLARKQFMQGDIADSYAELQQFRLLRPVHRLGDRPVQGLPAHPQEHRRHQGPHPQGASTTPCGGRCTPTAPSGSPTRCPSAACG